MHDTMLKEIIQRTLPIAYLQLFSVIYSATVIPQANFWHDKRLVQHTLLNSAKRGINLLWPETSISVNCDALMCLVNYYATELKLKIIINLPYILQISISQLLDNDNMFNIVRKIYSISISLYQSDEFALALTESKHD